MESILNNNLLFSELKQNELYEIDGGVDWIVFIGGCITVGLGVVAVGAAAVVGGCLGGPAGAAAAAGAATKAVFIPLGIAGAAAIALSLRY